MNTTTAQNELSASYVNEVAKTINAQMFATVENKWVFFSWGVSRRFATVYNGMAALGLRVSGLLHKGFVYICYNEGRDVYEVHCVSLKGVVKKSNKEVYCDNLGFVLDGMIERSCEQTNEAYRAKAMRDSAKKMGLQII
ncbi:MAG: hypothetical protein IKX67_07245 [Bacteroidales bacterium]|nr:hypothetical protein [Bacteroidales bacterium]